MSEPTIPAKSPFPVEVKAGETYFWCACGRSQGQPFCDGSHRGTGLGPIAWKAEESTSVYFCGCKHSASKPFCDGTHSEL